MTPTDNVYFSPETLRELAFPDFNEWGRSDWASFVGWYYRTAGLNAVSDDILVPYRVVRDYLEEHNYERVDERMDYLLGRAIIANDEAERGDML